jgi:hypothetical protein
MPRPAFRARNVDRESGKNRVSKRDKKPAPVESESEEYLSSDSELESELEMPAKDDSRRQKAAPPPPARKGQRRDGRARDIKGAEDQGEELAAEKQKETDSKVAPHMALLLAATYHMGISSIARPSASSFIPSAMNFFAMVDAMLALLVDSTMLHEMCPEFFSPVITLYYGHVFFYHVLRARNAAGSDVLTRLEKRTLTFYERVGPVESWPIAAPLLGMLQFFGSHKTEDPMFSWISPAFPDFSVLKSEGNPNALGSLDKLVGGARIPLIPALQKLIYNFANDIANYGDDHRLRPIGQDQIDATHTFCGITSSAITSLPFSALSGNLCWRVPQETGLDVGQFDQQIKQARIRRWNIPNVPDNADLSTLSGFVGFSDNQSFDWMKHLLSTAAIVNRFFPGSGNLSQVSPLTTIGSVTQIAYGSRIPPTLTANCWFYESTTLILAMYGYTNSESGLLDTRMAVTVSPNAEYSLSKSNRVSVAPNVTLAPNRTGPFFNDDVARPLTERRATFVTEATSQVGPTSRFLELLSPYFDNRAGKS